jgi:hypothetical protein
LSELDFVVGWPERVTRVPRPDCIADFRHYCRGCLQDAAQWRVRAEIRPGKALDALCGRTAGYPHGPARGDLQLSLVPALARALAGEEGGLERG